MLQHGVKITINMINDFRTMNFRGLVVALSGLWREKFNALWKS